MTVAEAVMAELVRLLDALEPPPVPEVRGLVRALQEVAAMPEQGEETRWQRQARMLLDDLPTTEVIRLVHTLKRVMQAARQEHEDTRQATRDRPSLQTAMDALSAYGLHYRTDAQYEGTWDYMGERLAAMSDVEVFAEHDRVRRGGADDGYEACRGYIVQRYAGSLDIREARAVIAVMNLLHKVTPPPVPEVVELVRELAEMRGEDRYRVVGDFGPENESMEIRWARRLDALPLSDVMRLVYVQAAMAEEARRDSMAAQDALHQNHTPVTARDYLSADGTMVAVGWMHDITCEYMLDRRNAMPLEDLFAEYERVRRGGGDYDGACRRDIVRKYMQRLDTLATAHDNTLHDLLGRVLSLDRPRFVDLRAVEREIAFWTRWEAFLLASDHQMDTTFLVVQTREKLEQLRRIREQALDNLAREVATVAFEVEDIRFEAERWVALALGLHPRVGRDCPLRGLEEITQMILDFAMLVEEAEADPGA
jgi:hypothetical protein